MGFFKPAWKSKNKGKALKAVEKETNQAKLGIIAKECPYLISFGNLDVGGIAVKNLVDQSILEDVAKNALYSGVRCEATEKLTNLNKLAEIAENDANSYVRLTAFRKLPKQLKTNKMKIDIAINGSGSDEQVEIINQLTDQEILKKVILNEKASKRIQELANNRLYELAILEVELTDNQRVLSNIAKDKNHKGQVHAINKITDQEVLTDIAKHDESSSIRQIAIRRLIDERILVDIVINAKDNWDKKEALNRINNQATLYEIVLNNPDSLIAEEAVKKIKDQDLLADIIKNAKVTKHYNETWPNVRILAIRNINNQTILAAIARDKNESGHVRKAAIYQITDKTILKNIKNSVAKDYTYTTYVSTCVGLTELDQKWENVKYSVDLREIAESRLKDL